MAALGITVLKHNVPWGPFTHEQIDDGLVRGDFTVKYLAHAPGLKEWLPLGEVLDYVTRRESTTLPVLPPVPETRELPPVPQLAGPSAAPPQAVLPSAVLPSAGPRPPILPSVPPKAQEPPHTKPAAPPLVPVPEPRPHVMPELETASFFLRGIAFLVDCGLLFIPVLLLFILGVLSIEIPTWFRHSNSQAISEEWTLLRANMWRLSGVLAIGCGWLYAAGLEASRSQATIGKRWMGLKVTDEHGERLTFLRATGRYAAKYLSALPCFLGFMMAIFSSRGLALHDRLAGTRVVKD
jgi:uncharacterized RDD family membrane protein YckC